ncbi:hypothetical protein D1007_57472 [Hordeum vulgare]|nr:hypothetical protein D1007_57472 [Hordeum vulgare]
MQLRRDFDAVVILLDWCISKERNARIFEETASVPAEVVSATIGDLRSWRVVGYFATAAALELPAELEPCQGCCWGGLSLDGPSV